MNHTEELKHLLDAIIQDLPDADIADRARQCSHSDKQQAIHWCCDHNFKVPTCLYSPAFTTAYTVRHTAQHSRYMLDEIQHIKALAQHHGVAAYTARHRRIPNSLMSHKRTHVAYTGHDTHDMTRSQYVPTWHDWIDIDWVTRSHKTWHHRTTPPLSLDH